MRCGLGCLLPSSAASRTELRAPLDALLQVPGEGMRGQSVPVDGTARDLSAYALQAGELGRAAILERANGMPRKRRPPSKPPGMPAARRCAR